MSGGSGVLGGRGVTGVPGVLDNPGVGGVHVVLPNDIDDPATPSGGNVYDRQVCRGLAAGGWAVHEHAVAGAWPTPGAGERADLARVLASLPDHAVVLVDGLVASGTPDVLVPEARRLCLVVLVHMPLGDLGPAASRREGAALGCAAAVVTTSAWARHRLLELYDLPESRVQVATPGADPVPVVPGSDAGTRLLCVAAVIPRKAHDVMTEALASVADLTWSCVCVGARTQDPAFAERVRRQAEAYGLGDRVRYAGPLTGDDLHAAYSRADLVLLASHSETYGMVVTEALARGLPVLATAVDGVPEALGSALDGSRPGMLVPPGDSAALAGALRRWLGESELRQQLRQSARGRRTTLAGWAETTTLVAKALRRAPATRGAAA